MTRPILSAAVAAVLFACAGPVRAETPAAPASADPLEGFNRAMYGFNKAVVD